MGTVLATLGWYLLRNDLRTKEYREYREYREWFESDLSKVRLSSTCEEKEQKTIASDPPTSHPNKEDE